MKTKKHILLAALMSLCLCWSTATFAQTGEQHVKQAMKRIFSRIDQGDIIQLKGLLHKDIEVFDSTYPLRIEGWDEFKDYLLDLRLDATDLRTTARQLRVHIIGTTAVVNFYYTVDYKDVERPQNQDPDKEDPLSEEFIVAEGTDEVGRGTVVFVQENGKWIAITIHLSQFPVDMF